MKSLNFSSGSLDITKYPNLQLFVKNKKVFVDKDQLVGIAKDNTEVNLGCYTSNAKWNVDMLEIAERLCKLHHNW